MTNDLDYWRNIWKKRMLDNIVSRGNMDCTQYWETIESARNYHSLASMNTRGIDHRLSEIGADEDSTILDIGAGTGILSIPLSKISRRVTAIEPSATMSACLIENIVNNGCNNISIINKRWEDINLDDLDAPYVKVIASYSLGFIDIVPALEKMNAVASDSVHLFWFADNEESYANDRSIRKIMGVDEPIFKPQSDVLFNVLYNMGYNPTIKIRTTVREKIFDTIDEAVEYETGKYKTVTDDGRTALQDYIDKNFQKPVSGKYVIEEKHRSASISWIAGQ